MSRIHVVDGQLCFNLAFTFEMAVLSRGPEEARATMRDAAMRTQDDGAREAMLETADSPVLVPLTQTDKYERAYRFCRELGEGVRGEVIRSGEPSESVYMAFANGFISVGGIGTPQYEGAAGLCFKCGDLAGNLVASLFPEDDAPDFQPPDFEEITGSFLAGVALGQAARN
jgi:hypothetical protein